MAANIGFPEIESRPEGDGATSTTMREKATNLGRKMVDAVDAGREGIADRLDGAAKRADRASGIAEKAAAKLESMATYVRDNDTRALMGQLETLVRAHPGKSLIAIAAIGYLAGRALRRS